MAGSTTRQIALSFTYLVHVVREEEDHEPPEQRFWHVSVLSLLEQEMVDVTVEKSVTVNGQPVDAPAATMLMDAVWELVE